jgi:LPLT family lysophospholipid transporter-like MFS transporter
VLQFLVLRWAQSVLQLALSQAALLQAAVAVGMVAGAVGAARWIPMRRVLKVLPLGLLMGALLLLMLLVTKVWAAVLLLAAIGAMAGLLLVPMNALLQQRGQLLMHPGQSIAVQNFHETLASLVLLAVYGGLVQAKVPLGFCIAGFGVFLSLSVGLIMLKQRANRSHAHIFVRVGLS